MNIFAVSPNVYECAEILDDKRLIKQILETAQLVSTALMKVDYQYYKIRRQLGKAYLPTHINHPCSKWARKSTDNFWWLVSLGKAYSREYTYRFGKVHASQKVFDGLLMPKYRLPTSWANVSGIDHQDVHWCYEVCLNEKWDRGLTLPRWTKRSSPWWYEKD